ncbi:hemerythrin domain-containing protein [Streptomyces sp. NBC_00096]|uniref:hemerythrin domain-containing protein n=1 Tax=Streptomyces sp. NBC_00096 TaxID=2975650 RepID=UPI0032551750
MNTETGKKAQPGKARTDHAPPGAPELAAVHRGLRREARLLVALVAAAAPGDTARARVLAGHFRSYRRSLRHCLDAEESCLWPPLLARLDLDADLVLRSTEQHEHIAATLAAAAAALPAWESGAGEADRDALTALLAEHRAVLTGHLAEEAGLLFPLAVRHLDPYQWEALGAHLTAADLGTALEDALPAERRALLGRLSLPARLRWYAAGRLRYARRAGAVRRAPRPAP